jgi:hypothetical protein
MKRIGLAVVVLVALVAGIVYAGTLTIPDGANFPKDSNGYRATVKPWASSGFSWVTPGNAQTGVDLGYQLCKHQVKVNGSWTTVPTSHMFTIQGTNDSNSWASNANYTNIYSFWSSLTAAAPSDGNQIVNACFQYIKVQWNSFSGTNNGTSTVTIWSKD